MAPKRIEYTAEQFAALSQVEQKKHDTNFGHEPSDSSTQIG